MFASQGCDRGKFNVFTVQDDIELGREVAAEIENDPQTYPILDRNTHEELYAHMYRIRDVILASDEIKYKNEFEWEIYIIDDDEIINAFAIPGGRTYFYTGLIRFLDDEASFAGVWHTKSHMLTGGILQQDCPKCILIKLCCQLF